MSGLPRILLVEDDADWQDIYRRCLINSNYEILSTRKLKTALEMLKEQSFDIVLTDLKMLGGKEEFSGFDVLKLAKNINPDIQVIVITGYGSSDHALRAMANGAYDYITKDRELRKKLPLTIQTALEIKLFKQEMLRGNHNDDVKPETDRIIGNSANMQSLFAQISHATTNSNNILILGEEGTGKRLIAQTIHRQSLRKGAQFWVIDCGSLSDNTMESEFFGYEEGSRFPGNELQQGKFEKANGGTIFLNGIDRLEVRFQSCLLEILSENSVTRIGGSKALPINVRIISSTNKDLKKMLANNLFRRELFDILNETYILVPPLRERKEGDDILALAAMFLQRHAGSSQIIFSGKSIELLSHYDYPGNVRELESIVKYALSVCEDGIIKPEHLRPELHQYAQFSKIHRNESENMVTHTEAFQSDIEPHEQINLPQLRIKLCQYFDENELHTICFDLGIDYQSLEAIGKDGKVRELVDFMRRRKNVKDLISMCRSLRPNIDW